MKAKIVTKWIFLLCVFLMTACHTTTSPPMVHKVQKSFYHWKQTLHFQQPDYQTIQALQLNTLYVRFFDIIWQPPTGAIPTAIIRFDSQVPDSLTLIPCVYIENKVFQQLEGNEEVEDLAEKSAKKIQSLLQKSGQSTIEEIQLDCDWSGTTRQKYFHFLAHFRKQWDNLSQPAPNSRGNIGKNLTLSATIRLHQIKYPKKTGVPPVDRGMLMYYNMGKIKEPKTRNSILDNQIGRQYISAQTEYDLPLDIALPIFEWGVWFQKGEFAGIFNDMHEAQLTKMGDFRQLKDNVYLLEKDTVMGNRYLRNGEVIRLEGVEAGALEEAAQLCREVMNTKELRVAFYHWDLDLIDRQGVDFLKEVYESFE